MKSRLSPLKPLVHLSYCVLLACAASAFAVEAPAPVFAPTPQQTFARASDWSRSAVKDLPTAANTPWTMNMFVKPEVALYELTLIGGFGNGRDEQGAQRYLGRIGDGIHFWGGGLDIETGVPFEVGSWQMLTTTFDGKTVTIYKNGKPIKSAPATFTDAASEVRLSPTGTWPRQQQHQFNGRIQGFAVWNSALSPSAISALLREMPRK